MGRSVYSLVLSDDVIRAVDRAAYTMNTSRSNLINEILADYVSYTTPEKQMRDIFDSLTGVFGSDEPFLIQSQGSDALLNIRSPLQVKYNPTIKYTVELSRNRESSVGELRIMTRTQSSELLARLQEFFLLFYSVEAVYFGSITRQRPQYEIGRGKFVRKFVLLRPDCSSDEIGCAIGKYIQTIDHALKSWMQCPESAQRSVVEKIYRSYLQEDPVIL